MSPRAAQRSIVQRASVALGAAAFLLAGAADAAGYRRCPHHDAAAAGRSFVQEGGPDHAQHETGYDPSPSQDEHGPCTCPGACQSTVSSPLLDEEASSLQPPSPAASTIVVGDEAGIPRWIAFRLPYAHAPPRLQ